MSPQKNPQKNCKEKVAKKAGNMYNGIQYRVIFMYIKRLLIIIMLFSFIALGTSCNNKNAVKKNNDSSVVKTQAASSSQINAINKSNKPAKAKDAVSVDNACTIEEKSISNDKAMVSTSSNSNKESKPEEVQDTSKQVNEQDKAQSTSGQEIPEDVSKTVVVKAESVAKKEVETDDCLKIAKILIGKLSIDEIKYLFDSAKRDYWETTSVEDIEKAREILFSKLSDDDIAQLMEIGKKWGRSMDILKIDLDVAATKEKQMRARGLIK